MTALRRILAVACGALAAACVPASEALAAGAPVPSGQSGRVGAVAPGGSDRFTTRRTGRAATLIVVTRVRDGRMLRAGRIAGRWTVPAVTVQGGTTGLSADGRFLLLTRPVRNYPPQSTPLALVRTRDLRVVRRVTLPGFFTVDAISPDGRWAYLIQYESQDALNYRVRALDTASGQLAARDVVDPRSPGEQMGGLPFTRAMSRDGRWAYTLYGGGSETFIHALDTVGRTAACIDLEMIPTESDLSTVGLRVSGDGRHVFVRDKGELVATVDARTFKVSEPGERPAAAPPRAEPPSSSGSGSSDSGGGFPWLAVLLGAVGLGGAVLLAARAFAGRGRLAS